MREGGAPRGLPGLRGLEWENSHRARWETPQGPLTLRLETEDWVRVGLDLAPGLDSPSALRVNASLPSNLRFAGPPHRRALVAEAWSSKPFAARSLREIRRGAEKAAAAEGHLPRGPGPSRPFPLPQELAASMEEIAGLDIVAHDDRCELGLRFRGRRWTVGASQRGTGLRLHRTLLAGPAQLDAFPAIVDFALRMNSRTRLARFALAGEELVVEAGLRRELVDAWRIIETTRAIVVISAHARAAVRMLTTSDVVSRCYSETFHLKNGGTSRCSPAPRSGSRTSASRSASRRGSPVG